LSIQCNTQQHWTEYKITWRVRSSVSGVCGQDCDVIYGPSFTKFGTWGMGVFKDAQFNGLVEIYQTYLAR